MKMLIVLIILFSTTVIFGQTSEPKPVSSEQIASLPLSNRIFRPKLSLQKAMKLMEKHIENNKIDTSKYYMTRVVMFQYGSPKGKKQPVWLFAWGHESGALGNYLHFIVDMDGNTGQLPTM